MTETTQITETIKAHARNLYTFRDIEDSASMVSEPVYVVRVGFIPVRDQIVDVIYHFQSKDIPVQKVTHSIIQVGGIRICFVNAMESNWADKIRGYKNFIKPFE